MHHRFKRGYKNVINESIRLNKEGQDTQIGIETSGHAALKENYFLDDGAYLVTKIIIKMAQMAAKGENVFDLIADLEEPKEAVEFRLSIKAEDFKAYGTKLIEELKQKAAEDSKLIPAEDNHEGVRVSLGKQDCNGWFLVRMSLHDPIIPINAESDEEGGLKKIVQELYQLIRSYDQLDLSPIAASLN